MVAVNNKIVPFLSASDRGNIARMTSIGFDAQEILARLRSNGTKTTIKTVRKWMTRFRNAEGLVDKSRGHKRHEASQELLDCIDQLMSENNEFSATQLCNRIKSRIGLDVPRSNVYRYRRDLLGWHAANTKYGQMIRHANKEKRHNWCEKHLLANTDFTNCWFSDESSIQLERSSKRAYVKVTDSAKRKLLVIQSKAKHPVKVHVWGGISWDGITHLAIFDGKVRMDARGYCQILKECYVEFANRHPNAILLQDSAPTHCARVTKEFFKENNIGYVEDWPAESPDLNVIECLWHQLKNYLRDETKPTTKAELIAGIKHFWEVVLTKETVRNYIRHIYTMIPQVIESKGDVTEK